MYGLIRFFAFFLLGVGLLFSEESNFVVNNVATVNGGQPFIAQQFATAADYDSDSVGYRCQGGAPTFNIRIRNLTDGVDIYGPAAHALVCDDTGQVLNLGGNYTIPAGKVLELRFIRIASNMTYSYSDANPYPNGDASGAAPPLGAGDDLYFAVFEAVPPPPGGGGGGGAIAVPVSGVSYMILIGSLLVIGAFGQRRRSE